MATPTRQGWIRRTIRRFAPVGEGWTDPPPDHPVGIRPDFSLCCEWHAERAFRQTATLAVPNTHLDDPSWSPETAACIAERLGAHPPRELAHVFPP
jgi:hypothetical protein